MLVGACAEHCQELALSMRKADVDELVAANGDCMLDPERRLWVLRASIAAGPSWAAIADDGRCIALLGCAPVSLVGGVAAPWLLGASGVERFAREFITLGRIMVDQWAIEWPTLVNWCDARNRASMRWLSLLGFVFDAPAPRGAAGLSFVRFSRVSGARGG